MQHFHSDVQVLNGQRHNKFSLRDVRQSSTTFLVVSFAGRRAFWRPLRMDIAQPVHHPPGFRKRRGLNWTFVGLLYTSFYTCRYNLPIANKSISEEFGFSKGQMGSIITTALLAYAFGQIINGLFTDRLGGKRAMLIGAAGTVIMNTIFGFASFWGLLPLFMVIRGIDGYLQAFGAPGMVKINAAWFAPTERGRFAGIFGFMINAGRFLINTFGPALLRSEER